MEDSLGMRIQESQGVTWNSRALLKVAPAHQGLLLLREEAKDSTGASGPKSGDHEK